MKKGFLLLVIYCLATSAFAQYGGFHFLGTAPKGALKNRGFGSGGGLEYEYISKPTPKTASKRIETRFFGSIDLQCVGYSKKIEEVAMPTPNNDKGYVYFENTTFGINAGPRFMLNTNTRLTPYADVLAAFRLYGTHRHNTLYDEEREKDLKEKDVTLYTAPRLQFGVSGGFLFRISRRTSFDFRITYTTGPGMQFVNLMDAWKDEDGSIRYRMDSSPTASFLTTRIGLMFNSIK